MTEKRKDDVEWSWEAVCSPDDFPIDERALVEDGLALARGFRERDECALRCVKRFIFWVCWSRLQNHDLADDATQQTFVKILHSFDVSYVERGSFRGWLYACALNTAKSLWRAEATRQHISQPFPKNLDPPAPNKTGVSRDLAEQIVRVLKWIPHQHQRMIYYIVDDFSYAQIAEMEQISISKVTNRIYAARQKIRQLLRFCELE